MDRSVVDFNIAHFKRLLKTETDPTKRQTIERLLAEEAAKLPRISTRENGEPPNEV